MSALTALIVTKLGVPIAKSLAGLWIENKLGQAAAGGVIDILAGRLADGLGRHFMATGFERLGGAIAQKVAQDLAELSQGEAEKLAEHLALLTQAMAENPLQLLEGSTKKTEVGLRLRKADLTRWNPVKGQFSQAAKTAYGHALETIGGELIANLAILSGWEVAAHLESLRRLQAVLERLDWLRADVERRDLGQRLFEVDYRKVVREKYDWMDLFGLPPEYNADGRVWRYPLGPTYVTLSLSGGSRTVSRPLAEVLDSASRGGRLRLLVTGEAGSGKTIMLRWIAIQCAGQRIDPTARSTAPQRDLELADDKGDKPRPLMNWRLRVPFLIRLRHVEGPGFPDPASWHRVEDETPSGCPDTWAKSILDRGDAFVLVDGLDEFPEDQRADLLASLRRHLDRHPDNACILTSRGAAVRHDLAEETDRFEAANIAPLEVTDRIELINGWFATLSKRLGRDAGPGLAEMPAELIAEIDAKPALAQLAGTPLLCAMLCALKYGSQNELPQNLTKICEIFIGLLLFRRDRSSKLPNQQAPEYSLLSDDDRKSLAIRLAGGMVDDGKSEIDENRALLYIHETVEALSEGAASLRTNPAAVLRAFLTRGGLLQRVGRTNIQFIHNSLKEYLAAEDFADRGVVERVVQGLPNPPWNEISRFMVGLNRDRLKQVLLSAMLDKVKCHDIKNARAIGHIILIAAAGQGGLRPELRQRLDALRRHVLPPKTKEEADLLAQIGNSLISWLHPAVEHTESEVAGAAARCLRRIGTADAIEALTRFAHDYRPAVAFEVVQALSSERCIGFWTWLASRNNSYNFRFPSGVTDRIASLPTCFTKLAAGRTSLDLSGMSKLTGIAALSGSKALEVLALRGTAVSDLSPLAEIMALKELYLSGTAVSNLSPLAGLTTLETLYLSGTDVSDLSPLVELRLLKDLHLDDTAVSDLSHVAGLTALELLSLAGTAVSDISPLARLEALQSLSLHKSAVTDISPLAGLTALEWLDLTSTAVADLSPVAGIPSLRIRKPDGSVVTNPGGPEEQD